MVTVKLINTLKKGNVIVKVVNLSIFAVLTTLHPGETYELKIGRNTTHREYVLFALPNNDKLAKFSSDEILQYKEIRIYKKLENGTEEVACKGILECDEEKVTAAANPNHSDTPGPSNSGDGEDSTATDVTKKKGNFLHRFWNKYHMHASLQDPVKETSGDPAKDATKGSVF